MPTIEETSAGHYLFSMQWNAPHQKNQHPLAAKNLYMYIGKASMTFSTDAEIMFKVLKPIIIIGPPNLSGFTLAGPPPHTYQHHQRVLDIRGMSLLPAAFRIRDLYIKSVNSTTFFLCKHDPRRSLGRLLLQVKLFLQPTTPVSVNQCTGAHSETQ